MPDPADPDATHFATYWRRRWKDEARGAVLVVGEAGDELDLVRQFDLVMTAASATDRDVRRHALRLLDQAAGAASLPVGIRVPGPAG